MIIILPISINLILCILLFIVYCVHVLYVLFDMCKINDSQSVNIIWHLVFRQFCYRLRSRIRTVKRHPPFTRYSTKRTVNYLSESESEVPTPIFASAWMWWMAEWRPCSEYRSLAVFSITASWLNILGNYCVAFGLWICGAINLRKKTERAAVRAYLNGI